ncbi:MAG: hypothetical protein AAGJ46_16690 [Planctomycetota bacterium]
MLAPRLHVSYIHAALAFALTATAATAQPTSITFTQRAPAVGDQSELTIAVDFQLTTTSRAGKQVLGQSETKLRRDHKRVVTTTALGPTGPIAATVSYAQAEQSVNDGPSDPEPVVGKTYYCERRGERLVVTTEAGALPPLDEYKIVATNMETLGKKNPLAEYFAGRTVTVGEELELPLELAGRLLGFDKQLAVAKRFSLKLKSIENVGGEPCAVFQTRIDAGSGGRGQMGLMVGGPLVMQAAGCRTVSAELNGPIGMSESQVTAGGSRQITGVGKMKVSLGSRYRSTTLRR